MSSDPRLSCARTGGTCGCGAGHCAKQPARPTRTIDTDKLKTLVRWYLDGDLPENLYWTVDVSAEVLRRALEQVQARTIVPPGYALVPIRPTKDMIDQACRDNGFTWGFKRVFRKAWTSMINAAPRIERKL